MKIAVGCDHAGYKMKLDIMEHLKKSGHEAVDFGAYSEESVDYPVFAQKAALSVVNGEAALGILICGTGAGISISANKVKGARCVACSEPFTAKLSREHNNANLLAIGSRVVGIELAKMIVDSFISASFEGGRHERRVGLIGKIENGEVL